MRSTHVTKFAAITGALALPLLAATSASATTGPVSSAYGISATGVVTLPATPAVNSAAKPHEATLTKFPANPVITTFSIAKTTALGDHSLASLMYVGILTPKVTLPAGTPKLPGQLVLAKVAAARCDAGKGVSHIEGLRIADKTVKTGTSPNTKITVPVLNLGHVTATLNKQVRGSDGMLTVTAVELNIVLAGKAQTVDISSATCGGGSTTGNPAPGSGSTTPGAPTTAPTPAAPASGGEAPVPTPVKSDLPVTG
ncbi:MAG: choice-of-anchor P family protein [Actinoallomurus sp.]